MGTLQVQPTGRSEGRHPSKLADRAIATTGVCLALPKALVDLAALSGFHLPVSVPHIARPVLNSFEVLGVSACSVWIWRRFGRPTWQRVDDWLVEPRLAPSNKRPPDEFSDAYTSLIREHVLILEMSQEEFARRAMLSRRGAKFLLNHPDFFPRIDVVEQVRAALMVPSGWTHGGYGPKFTKQRLLWHSSKGHTAHSMRRIKAMTNQQRATILGLIERTLRADLDLDGSSNAQASKD